MKEGIEEVAVKTLNICRDTMVGTSEGKICKRDGRFFRKRGSELDTIERGANKGYSTRARCSIIFATDMNGSRWPCAMNGNRNM